MDKSLFIILGIILFVGVAVVAWLASRKRRNDLAAWAGVNGLTFDPDKFYGLDERFPDFDCFRQGGSRYAYNAIAGTWNGRDMVAFDYHYTTGSGKDEQTHQFSAVIIGSRTPLRPLFIRPEGFFDKVADFFGYDDIDFESAEFSRRFFVKSTDRKWAYDVLHARTMEFLMAAPVFTIKFSPRHVIAYRSKRFAPGEFGEAADVVAGMLDRLPEYLVRQQEGSPNA
jgi:hypothetical protein